LAGFAIVARQNARAVLSVRRRLAGHRDSAFRAPAAGHHNPAVGNYEELGDLCLDDEQFTRARECFDRVISMADSIDPRYRRALCALALDDYPSAAADLDQVVARDPK
jgi:tetratricopeptide (TPR) repeat protein